MDLCIFITTTLKFNRQKYSHIPTESIFFYGRKTINKPFLVKIQVFWDVRKSFMKASFCSKLLVISAKPIKVACTKGTSLE